MRDEEFEDSVARMLHGRAASLPGQGDPVGATKQHLRSAQTRRRTVYSATAVLVVAGGAALGGQAFGSSGHSGTSQTFGPASGATTPVATPSVTPSPTPGTVGSTNPKAVPPSPTDFHGQACGTATKEIHRDVTKYTDGLRGSLAGQSDLLTSLKSRATALVDGADAKVVYAGEDAATRVVVVYVNPKTTESCEEGMLAVVFHGPAGTPAEALKAQVGYASFGPNFGFTWSERNADHTLTALVLSPGSVRTLSPAGDITGRTPGTRTNITTPDGSYLTTYAAGATIPLFFDFKAPNGLDATSTLNFVTSAATKPAYAEAVGVTPDKVTEKVNGYAFDGTPLHDFAVAAHSGYVLQKTVTESGAEAVYWASYFGG